jgi:single-strand DNA-binding protein
MNKVILMGRLTADSVLKYTSNNNTAVCNFTIAVNRRFKQEGQPDADFFNIIAWSKLGEFCGKYFAKGMQVAVVGRLQNRNWNDNDGKKHYVTEIVADEAYFAEGKKNTDPNDNLDVAPSKNDDINDDELPF